MLTCAFSKKDFGGFLDSYDNASYPSGNVPFDAIASGRKKEVATQKYNKYT